MNRKKLISFFVGGTFAFALIIGILFLAAPKAFSVATAIVVICLSLASGLILPNPVSFWFLVAGVCMLVFPAWVVGLILICAAAAGMAVNPWFYFRR